MNQKAVINVTPLIDVLLVLLIIFMVISPLKPTDFKAHVPAEPLAEIDAAPHPDTLVVTLNRDHSIAVNGISGFGSLAEPQKLIAELSRVFAARSENRHVGIDHQRPADLSDDQRVQKTVFIKAPRGVDYGSVVKVIDSVKISGADPISLQIDDLD